MYSDFWELAGTLHYLYMTPGRTFYIGLQCLINLSDNDYCESTVPVHWSSPPIQSSDCIPPYCTERPLAFLWMEVSKAAQKANSGSGSA